MKKSGIAIAALMAVLVMIALFGTSQADSPLPPPAKKTIWSASKQFFAVMEPDKEITTIYRSAQGKQAEKVWSMYGWFRVAALTDDGEHLVVGYWGINLLPIEYDKRQVMLYFFKRGELINYVTLDQIIRDNSRLQRTVSHYAWGMFNGLDQAGRYVIETVEGRTIRYDVATGTPVTEGSTPRPSDQTKTPRH
jgi:hypothetical protein